MPGSAIFWQEEAETHSNIYEQRDWKSQDGQSQGKIFPSHINRHGLFYWIIYCAHSCCACVYAAGGGTEEEVSEWTEGCGERGTLIIHCNG